MKKRLASAFSLVELTLALGIAAFCLIAVFGLIPVTALTNRNATSQTAATNIMAVVVSDLRATSKACTESAQFGIQFGVSTTLYFDGQAQSSCNSTGSQKYVYQFNPNDPNKCSIGTCSGSWTPALQLRYRLTITWSGSTGLRYADLKVTWPAAADPTTITPTGSTEMLAAFDRN